MVRVGYLTRHEQIQKIEIVEGKIAFNQRLVTF